MNIGDSPVAKVIAVIGVALFALYVLGTWEEKPAAPPVARQVVNPAAPDHPLVAPNGLWGIRLGDKFDRYASSHGPFDKEPARPGSVKKNADDEDFVQRKGQLRVGVRKGLVSSVAYSCKQERDPTTMNNVACYAGGERIKTVFGDRVRILCPKLTANDANKELAASVRAYDIAEYQTRYVVIKDEMTGFIVFEPGELETLVGINWEKCAGEKSASR